MYQKLRGFELERFELEGVRCLDVFAMRIVIFVPKTLTPFLCRSVTVYLTHVVHSSYSVPIPFHF